MGFSKDAELIPQLGVDLALDPILAARARRAVALREDISAEERYELLEMLGLVEEGDLNDSACGEADRREA